jgi:hypothetical protein
MRLIFAFLADHANITQDGKLNVLGISDHVFSYRFPATHRELFFINSLETDGGDDGTVQIIDVSIIDADGKTIAQAGGEMHIHGVRQRINQIHVFQDLLFERAGLYEVHMRLNGNIVSTHGLEVIELPPTTEFEPGPPPG